MRRSTTPQYLPIVKRAVVSVLATCRVVWSDHSRSAFAKERGASAKQLAPAQEFYRQAEFLFDFVEAENSTGFHAPQEAARVLAQSIDLARQGQLTVGQIKDQPTK